MSLLRELLKPCQRRGTVPHLLLSPLLAEEVEVSIRLLFERVLFSLQLFAQLGCVVLKLLTQLTNDRQLPLVLLLQLLQPHPLSGFWPRNTHCLQLPTHTTAALIYHDARDQAPISRWQRRRHGFNSRTKESNYATQEPTLLPGETRKNLS